MSSTNPELNSQNDSNEHFNNYRLGLVSILFGLVLTEASVQFYQIFEYQPLRQISIERVSIPLSHFVLAVGITISSWFGWHKSVNLAATRSASHIKILSIIDLAMVMCYFGLARNIFNPNKEQSGSIHSATPSAILISTILFLYILYDIASKIHPDETWKIPWPSSISFLFSVGILMYVLFSNLSDFQILLTDGLLFMLVVWFFRSAKHYQRYRLNNVCRPKTSYRPPWSSLWGCRRERWNLIVFELNSLRNMWLSVIFVVIYLFLFFI